MGLVARNFELKNNLAKETTINRRIKEQIFGQKDIAFDALE